MKKILFLMLCIFTVSFGVANAQAFEKGDGWVKASVGYTNSDLNKRMRNFIGSEPGRDYRNLWSGSVEAGVFLFDNFALAGEIERVGATGVDQMMFNLKAQYYLYNFYVGGGYSAAKIDTKEFKHRAMAELGYVLFINKSKTLSVEPAVVTYIEPHFKKGNSRFYTDLAFKLGIGIRL